MNNLKLLIVEGNTKEVNSDFHEAGCIPQSDNFTKHIHMYEPSAEIDIVEPENDTAISVQLTVGGKSIKFGKTSDSWQIVKPALLRADNYVVSDLVRSVSDVEMMAVLEDTGKSTRRYYSRRPAALVEITDAAGSHTLTIFRGREGDEEYYAKSSDLTGIFEISSTVPSNLDKELADFRNDKLFDFGFKGIASLEVRNGATDLTIRKHENAWELASRGGQILDSIKVQALIDALRNLTAKSYPSDQEISFVKYGLKEPMIEVNITTEEGSVDEVFVGIPKNNQIYEISSRKTISFKASNFLKNKIKPKNAKIAVLGLGFRGDVTDTRLSPTYDVVTEFIKQGCNVTIHDPYIFEDKDLPKSVSLSKNLKDVTKDASLIFISSDHKMYSKLTSKSFSKGKKPILFFDGRNILSLKNFSKDTALIKTIGTG